MAFPKTLNEMTERGYKFKDHAECRGCGDPIEWWETPNGRNIPMNPMTGGESEAAPHWVSCTEQDLFRKKD